ncbi:MAG: hypothetical protein WD894_15895 [Pirellulales bacterium]
MQFPQPYGCGYSLSGLRPCAVFRYFERLREIHLSETNCSGYIASFVRDDATQLPRMEAGVFLCAVSGGLVAGGLVAGGLVAGDRSSNVHYEKTRRPDTRRPDTPPGTCFATRWPDCGGKDPRGMNDRESSEKRTVERTDELLQKSRRLIDELEFILESLQEDPQRANKECRNESDSSGGGARSS